MSACYCDWDYQATVYRKAVHIARKAHQCYECGRKIQPGERYENVFAIWDGDPSTVRTCPHCLALRDFVVAHIPCSCWSHGNMIEEIMNDAEHWAREAPGLLFGAMRRMYAIDTARGYKRMRRKETTNASA